MPTTNPRGRRLLALALRLLLGAGILAWLFTHMPISELGRILRQSLAFWPWWLAGVGLTGLGLLMGVLRWHLILATLGLPISRWRVFSIFFSGQFFNAFFLGACGGDLVRAFFAARLHPDHKPEAITTVVLDRAIGLFTCLLVGCALILLRWRTFFDQDETHLPEALMSLFLVASVLGLVILFRRNLFETWPFFRRLETQRRVGPLLRKGYEVFFFFRRRPAVMAACAGYSLLNLVFLTLAGYCLGISLQLRVPLLDFFAVFQVVTVFTAIPITPGGLGVREGLFAQMLAGIDVASYQAVPLSLLIYLAGTAWSLFGGLLFVLHAGGLSPVHRADIAALRNEQLP